MFVIYLDSEKKIFLRELTCTFLSLIRWTVLSQQDLYLPSVFFCCVVFLSICCALQHWLYHLSFRFSTSTDDVKGESLTLD